MKAKDFMIGDWVTDGKLKFQIERADFYSMSNFRNLSPIPITSEILEKNGFINICLDCWGECPDFIFALDKQQNSDKWMLKILSHTYRDTDAFCITYVHELQHLFKLCGNEKEIEL